MSLHRITVATPIGPIAVVERDGAIVAIDWGAAKVESPTPLLAAAARQIEAYFRRETQRFDLPLAPSGTAFDQAVWDAMRRIPYGATRSYGELARLAGGMPRAVGVACGRNPIPILIPCHRVVGGSGLGGYSGLGGTKTKRFLLGLEGAMLPLDAPPAPAP